MFYSEIMVRISSFKHDTYKINTSVATVKLDKIRYRRKRKIMQDCQSVQVTGDRNASWRWGSHQIEDVMLEQFHERRLVLGWDSDNSGTHRTGRPGFYNIFQTWNIGTCSFPPCEHIFQTWNIDTCSCPPCHRRQSPRPRRWSWGTSSAWPLQGGQWE